MEWKTIDSAPKDGTEIDLWNGDEDGRVPSCYWLDGQGWVSDICDMPFLVDMNPTHWMPLPEPPK